MTHDAILADLHPDDAAALESLPTRLHDVNGVPDPATAAARRRAADEATRILDTNLVRDGMRVSPLGPAWSNDLDCHVLNRPDRERLRGEGWIDLSALMASAGYGSVDRWAIVVADEIVGAADLHVAGVPDPVARVLRRCRERGEVRFREVLELRTLVRAGTALPASDPVVAVAAGIEATFPGAAYLSEWYAGHVRACPAKVPARRPMTRWVRGRLGRVRSISRRRIVVALGGVDGAGKSTVARWLLQGLDRAGVPCGRVWARPGMNIGWLGRLAVVLKRGSGAPSEPGVRAVAGGRPGRPHSRRGLVGSVWASLISVAYVVDTWRQHLTTRGIVVYDRHIVDALVTLDFVYGGVNLGFQRAFTRVCLPRARWTFFLDVPAEVATRRKPDDVFGAHAISRQLELYKQRLRQIPTVVVLDGQRDPRATAVMILSRVAYDADQDRG